MAFIKTGQGEIIRDEESQQEMTQDLRTAAVIRDEAEESKDDTDDDDGTGN